MIPREHGEVLTYLLKLETLIFYLTQPDLTISDWTTCNIINIVDMSFCINVYELYIFKLDFIDVFKNYGKICMVRFPYTWMRGIV